MQAALTEIVLSHDGVELARATLPPGEYVIGREPGVDLHAGTPLLSRRHARLTIGDDSILLEDLGSSNGSFVDDQQIAAGESVPLLPGKAVRLGDVTLSLQRQAGVSTDSTAPRKRYAIGSEVARGGMGAILAAQQAAMKRQVAMKVMLDGAQRDDIARFVNEAQITGQLEHPNIVPVHELDVDEQGRFFYTMKMVRGITLKEVLESLAEGAAAMVRKYPLPVLLTIYQKACDAVAFAHSKGILHRDLKPENIMLGDFGEVLVMDWGLAKRMTPESEDRTPESERGDALSDIRYPTSGLSTLTGTIMGTPAYMSPEQARGEIETLDERSDIYALGSILYHILALRPPYTGDDALEVVGMVAKGNAEALTSARDRPVPDSLAAVRRKAMAFKESDRYQTVAALQADLAAYQGGFATSAEHAGFGRQILLALRRHKMATAGVAAVLVVGATFGTKAIIEGRRAEREAVRANSALANLKKQAPSLLALAESEAVDQQFDSALGKIAAALSLDPNLPDAYWLRAWIFLAQEKFAESASALRIAKEKDPARIDFAAILPLLEKRSLSPGAPWEGSDSDALLNYCKKVGASFATIALSSRFIKTATDRLLVVRERLKSANLGGGSATVMSNGELSVAYFPPVVESIEFLRNLPIDRLSCPKLVASIEPLRGMPLKALDLYSCSQIEDFSPLKGMPLRYLKLRGATKFRDLTLLEGMPLTSLDIAQTKVTDISKLRGLPIETLDLFYLKTIEDFSPLGELPLRNLWLSNTNVRDLDFASKLSLENLDCSASAVSDLRPLSRCPLQVLIVSATKVTDLTPLRGLPVEILKVSGCRIADYAPLLDLPKLTKLNVSENAVLPDALRRHPTLKEIAFGDKGYVPVTQAWAEYDALDAVRKK